MASGAKEIEINYRMTLPPWVVSAASSSRMLPQGSAGEPAHLKLALVSLAQMAFAEEPAAGERPFLTGAATCTQDNLANISSLVRTLMPDSAPMQAIGVTTGVNVFQGWWAAKKAKARFDAARRIKDREGMIEGGIDTARGAFQSAGGAAYLGYRGTMIATNVRPLSVPAIAGTSLGKAAYLFGLIGNVCFTAFFALISLWSAYGLRNHIRFGAALKAASQEGDAAFLEFLKKRTLADPKSRQPKPSDKKRLQKAGLKALTEQFLHVQRQLMGNEPLKDKMPLSAHEVKASLKELFSANDAMLRASDAYKNALSSLGLNAADFSMLELIGFKLLQEKRQHRKEARFSRVTDGACVKAVQKAFRRGLDSRLLSSDTSVKEAARQELAELKKRVSDANSKGKLIHSALLAIGVIGFVLCVLGFLTLAHPVAIALVVVAMVFNVGLMIATDGYFLSRSWEAGSPGVHDKKYLGVMAAVLVSAVIVSLFVTAYFGLPLIPCIVACAFGGAGLLFTGYSFYRVVQKEKKWLEEHPDLEAFSRVLSRPAASDVPDDSTAALFKKLPKADRHRIREKYFEMAQRGEMPFRSARNLSLDTGGDFGGTVSLDTLEPHIRLRALKKTLKSLWEEEARAKTLEKRRAALDMQSFYERWVQNHQISDHTGRHPVLKRNLWYVAKRQESRQDLKAAVDAVLHERRSVPPIPASLLSTHFIRTFGGSCAA
jgi:hypothetical protein